MDPQSRQTASAYINNLLLSRGLLRNGTPIEFATPEKTEGGVNAAMSQVMNLVHDLILRRDRESDTLASLSQNLQTLRTSTTQQTQTITRLENRSADLDRQLALTGAQERAARATLRSAETRNRALREEMARLKGSVAQIRAQCATDVRRRDGEVQRLKRHLEGRRGRDGNGGQVGVVVVTPGLHKGPHGNRVGEVGADLEDPTYSLKQETTEFLTQLSQGLSDENDALISLVRGTLETLRSLQGLPTDSIQTVDMGVNAEELEWRNGLMGGPPSYEALASSTDEVLEHLRGLLTNPSFVPLEEVEIREEEIHRLREGWEKMAARWKEAVALMDGWKKRIVNTGDTINLDDLSRGIDLGQGVPTAQEAHENSLLLKQAEEADANTSDILQDLQDNLNELSNEDLKADAPVAEIDLDVLATGRALTVRDANARPAPSPKKVVFQPLAEENAKPVDDEDDLSLLGFSNFKALQRSPSKTKSRIPLQTHPRPTSPARTVQQKLARAEAEAEEARKREQTRPRRESIVKSGVTKKLKGSRRRSTLSPEELEGLMGIS
ncbi:hypothetical protein N7G274_005239 [Stereocaulon virgatum]|uniref:NIMA interactive protein n=1 Tax=Stereocaulon virgatum TaxID=373712 RepID=A0ABR4AB00_9LECA